MPTETITSEITEPQGETYTGLLSTFLSDTGKPAPKEEVEDDDEVVLEEKPAAKAKAAEPEKPKHAKISLRLGKSVGLSDAEMDALSDEELADEIFARQQELIAERRVAAKAEKPAPKVEDEFKPDWGDVDPEDIDPGIVKMMNKLAKQNHDLTKQLAQREMTEKQRSVQTLRQRIDAAFETAPEFFGKGKVGDRSKEAARRSAVVGQLARMQQLGEATGDVEADFAAAVEAVGFDLPKKTDRAKQAEIDAWNKGGIARPTARKPGDKPKGTDKAVETLDAAMDRNGFITGREASVDDFLPDN